MSDCKHEFVVGHTVLGTSEIETGLKICKNCLLTDDEIAKSTTIEMLYGQIEKIIHDNAELLKKIEQLQAREAELVGALRFYANEDTYKAEQNYRQGGYNDPAIYSDEGTNARKALQGCSEYAEHVKRLQAVAKAAEEAVHHDYITPELHEAMADWRSNE